MASENLLDFWVIYKNPSDYPNKFVVRRWDVVDGTPEPVPRQECFVENSLEAARARVPSDRINLGRWNCDDPVIFEVWT